MNNIALRKAMLYAMNIDTINRRFYHDLSFRVNTTIPEQYGQFHDSSIPGYPYNLSKAKHLLDKAGYKYQKGAKFRRQPNGKPLTINLAVRSSSSNAGSVWSNYIQQWKKIGLNVRFLGSRPMEFNSWVQAIKAADPRIDVFEGGQGLEDASPSSLYGQNSQLNFARFVSKTNNKLLDEIDSKKSFNTAYRITAFRKWQRWMYDKAYLVPTSNSYTLTAVNANVTG